MQEANQNTEQEIVESEELVHDAYVEGVLDDDQIGQLRTVFDVQEQAATVAPEVHDRIEDIEEVALGSVSAASDVDVPVSGDKPEVFDVPKQQQIVSEVGESAAREIKIPRQ